MPKSGWGLAHPRLWAELSRQTSVLTPGPTGHWYLLKSALQLFGFGVFFCFLSKAVGLQKMYNVYKRYIWYLKDTSDEAITSLSFHLKNEGTSTFPMSSCQQVCVMGSAGQRLMLLWRHSEKGDFHCNQTNKVHLEIFGVVKSLCCISDKHQITSQKVKKKRRIISVRHWECFSETGVPVGTDECPQETSRWEKINARQSVIINVFYQRCTKRLYIWRAVLIEDT